MGLYGSPYNYVIHVAIIATSRVALLTSFQPPLTESGNSPVNLCFSRSRVCSGDMQMALMKTSFPLINFIRWPADVFASGFYADSIDMELV